MDRDSTLEVLRRVAAGGLSPEQASVALSASEYVDLGFAKIDLGRRRRRGAPEFVYCATKTLEQIISIVRAIDASGQNVLCTRVSPELAPKIRRQFEGLVYNERARTLSKVNEVMEPAGTVAVVCAGTSDLPIAEEAAVTAEIMGTRVVRVADVGVAGLQRLIDQLEVLARCDVVVCVAGMEGALPSVLGGLVEAPVIAVPTSVGYGTTLGGMAALLAMLNSCTPGISVVNIDNGFGAGYQAAIIARTRHRSHDKDGTPRAPGAEPPPGGDGTAAGGDDGPPMVSAPPLVDGPSRRRGA